MSALPKTFELNNGQQIPSIGLGTWQSEPGAVEHAVAYAIKEAGYRHVDGAYCYQNEKEVGQGVKDSGVPRSEIFLTSKLWCTYHSKVAEGLTKTLNELGTDYLDLYLMHWPVAMNPNGSDDRFPEKDGKRDLQLDRHFTETWKDLEKEVESGRAKSIGVSNFSIENLSTLLKTAKIKPVVNQVESHPYLAQKPLKEFCEKNGILLQAYSPLGSTNSPILKDPEIVKIAERLNTGVGNVLISFQVARGVIVLPKSVTPSRISSNLQLVNLTPQDIEVLSTMEEKGKQQRFVANDDTQLPVKSFVLNNGHQIPSLGYGTYKTSPGEAKEAIKRALKQGYRHIDNADCYGNAKEISDGIKESNIPREKLFITSKLWVTYHDHVEEAIDKILKELDTNYLDLLLIHFPTPLRYIPEGTSTVKYPKTGDGKLDAVNIPLEQTWKDMEEYGIRSGKVRSIGVSNFSVKNLEKIVNSCQILPAVNQIECHPYLPCHTEYNYAKRYGILLEAYSPLGGSNAHLIEDEEVLSIANKHKVSPSQVIISWNTQRGVITLPKSLSEDHIKENSRLINLTNDEMEVLGTMPSRGKFNRYMKPDWSPHKLGFEDWD